MVREVGSRDREIFSRGSGRDNSEDDSWFTSEKMVTVTWLRAKRGKSGMVTVSCFGSRVTLCLQVRKLWTYDGAGAPYFYIGGATEVLPNSTLRPTAFRCRPLAPVRLPPLPPWPCRASRRRSHCPGEPPVAVQPPPAPRPQHASRRPPRIPACLQLLDLHRRPAPPLQGAEVARLLLLPIRPNHTLSSLPARSDLASSATALPLPFPRINRRRPNHPSLRRPSSSRWNSRAALLPHPEYHTSASSRLTQRNQAPSQSSRAVSGRSRPSRAAVHNSQAAADPVPPRASSPAVGDGTPFHRRFGGAASRLYRLRLQPSLSVNLLISSVNQFDCV
ncbi:WAS/WASL-interacting protein family member 1 [Triticum aestivum]|uniref:WAS/WASL-interacting protein family member 1 n=1 Tax=Triticum aestivum TaxID=4565 RepID=UPI001D00466A|nr:WAS/WASL-interacting protein family member 1-like [Triticum aestivum]